MKVINKDPRNTIPPITERDLTKSVVIICMQSEGGDRWLYLAGNSINLPGTVCWIGGNIMENNHIHEWHANGRSKLLIELILHTYNKYDIFEPIIWIAENIIEVELILNKISRMHPLFREEFLHKCSYLKE